jgi:hypothetical protein
MRFLGSDEPDRMASASLRVKSSGTVLASIEIEPEEGAVARGIDDMIEAAERKWKAEKGSTSTSTTVILDMEVVVTLWQRGVGNFDVVELPGLVGRPPAERAGREAVASSYFEGDRTNRYFICMVAAGTFLHNDQVLPFMEGQSNGSQVCDVRAQLNALSFVISYVLCVSRIVWLFIVIN